MAITPQPRLGNPGLDNQRAIDNQRRAVSSERIAMGNERSLQRGFRRAVRRGDMKAVATLGGVMNGLGINPLQGGGITNSLQQQEIATQRANGRAQIGDQMLKTLNPGGQGDANDVGQQAERRKSNTNGSTLQGSQRRAGESEEAFKSRTGGSDSTNPPAGSASGANINSPTMVNGQEALFADSGDGAMEAAIAMSNATYGSDGLDSSQRTAGVPSFSPKTSFAEQERVAREKSQASGAFGGKFTNKYADSRQKFAEELTTSQLIADADPKAMERAYKRGENLGLNREQIQKHLGHKTDSELAKEEYTKQFGESDKDFAALEAKYKEQFPGLDLSKLSPQEKKDAVSKLAKNKLIRDEKYATESKERSSLIKGAKKEVQALIDDRDSFREKGRSANSLSSSIDRQINGLWTNRTDEDRAKAITDQQSQLGSLYGVGTEWSLNDSNFQEGTDKLKQFRGSPAYSEAQAAIVSSAEPINTKDDLPVDKGSSRNLFEEGLTPSGKYTPPKPTPHEKPDQKTADNIYRTELERKGFSPAGIEQKIAERNGASLPASRDLGFDPIGAFVQSQKNHKNSVDKNMAEAQRVADEYRNKQVAATRQRAAETEVALNF